MSESLVRENRILSAFLEVSRVLNSSFELENTIERLVVMSAKNIILPTELPINLQLPSPESVSHKESLQAGIEDIEKSSILSALEKSGWVQARAARILGLTPRQIGYKMKKYGVSPPYPV